MSGTDLKLKNGTLILEQIPIKRILIRKVCSNNQSSGRVTVPKELIGKEIYILIKKGEEK